MPAATVSAVDQNAVVRAGRVAVVAHSGKTLDGGLGQLRSELAAAGIDDPQWFEVPKSKRAPKRVRSRARQRRRPRVRVGRRRDGAALRRRGWPARRRRSRSSPRAPPISSRRTSASRRTSRAAVEIGLHGRPAAPRPRCRQRRALRGHGRRRLRRRDDPRRRRHVEGRRLGRAAYFVTGVRGTGIDRVATRVRRRRRQVVRRQGELRARRQRRQGARRPRRVPRCEPDDGRSRSASSPPKGAGSGCAPWPAPRSGRRQRRRSCEMTRAGRFDVRFAEGDRPTSSTAATGKKTKRLRIVACRRRRSRSAFRRRSLVSTATPVPETVAAHRRRRACRLLRSCGRGAAPPRRVRAAARRRRVQPRALARVRDVARVRAGDHRPHRTRGRSRQRQLQHASSCARCRQPCPDPAAISSPTPSAKPTAPASRHRYAGLAFGLVGALDHGQHAVRAVRARPQPHLRRRAGPADRAEVRPGAGADGHRRHSSPCSRSPLLAFGQTIGTALAQRRGQPRLGRRPLAGSQSCSRRSRSRCCSAARLGAASRRSRGWPSAPRSSIVCWLIVTGVLGLFFSAEPVVRPDLRARWRASSRSCCGHCSPRSRSSTAARSPPSSRRSGRASRAPQDRPEGRALRAGRPSPAGRADAARIVTPIPRRGRHRRARHGSVA